MQQMFQLQQAVNKLLEQYAKDAEWTLECLHKEQEVKEVLKELKQKNWRIPNIYKDTTIKRREGIWNLCL